jgi:hypothetical protein
MTENVTVYGVGDLRTALESIGATTRQLSYLVAKGHITPSVRLTGRLGYTTDDLSMVFLLLGPLLPLDLPIRKRVASAVLGRVFGSTGRFSGEPPPGPAFEEFDLEGSNNGRCPAVKLRVDRQELMADFATFMAAVSG